MSKKEKMRKKGKKEKKKAQPLKMTFYLSNSSEPEILVISIEGMKDGNHILTFLIDKYKIGLKNFFSYSSGLYQIFNKYPVTFNRIDKKKAIECLVYGYSIAKVVGTPISSECLEWLKKFDIVKYKTKGSLYKCFKCKTGELNQKYVKEILVVAKEEIISKIAGTKDEKRIFYQCKRCENLLNSRYNRFDEEDKLYEIEEEENVNEEWEDIFKRNNEFNSKINLNKDKNIPLFFDKTQTMNLSKSTIR